MSLKWTRNQNESGILRKNEFKEKKEELFVFGYSCKLFRDDEKALHIDQGKHLIPWMGDETLKIDRYDARGALHSLTSLEAPPGGFDWRVELTRTELDVEQLCDEERYRALHTDEDEEEMYKEEELKRLHAAGYGQVSFNYETPAEATTVTPATEVDEPFVPSEYLKGLLPDDVVFPDSEKLNAIIDKTAKFIATQGAQMEILLRAKQADNPQFQFLNKESPLHAYYLRLIALVKAEKWPEREQEVVEDKHSENEDYLHPSLGSTIIESAPSIPSIQYRPSADCDYTMLICKIRGGEGAADGEDGAEGGSPPPPAPGELPPPGTVPLALPPRRPPADIARPPVMYNTADPPPPPSAQTAYSWPQQPPPPAPAARPPAPPALALQPPPQLSTGLSLMRGYGSDTDHDDDSDESDSSTPTTPPIPVKIPPEEVKIVIDKMAGYVARNGDDFAEIVRAKNDPRFMFLEPNNEYHGFYLKLMMEKRGVTNGKEKVEKKEKTVGVSPVSFSIKKLKEPDPVLPKPALPYESSSEEESEQSEKTDTTPEPKLQPETVKIPIQPLPQVNNAVNNVVNNVERVKELTPPPKVEERIKVVIEKPVVKAVVEKPIVKPEIIVVKPKAEERSDTPEIKKKKPDKERSKDERKRVKNKDRDYEKRKHKADKNRDSRSRSKSKRDKSPERDRRKDRVEEKKIARKMSEMEIEIISLDETDEMIDLTDDLGETKGADRSAEVAKQQERRRRAAEFLRCVGVAGAAPPPPGSLASAMVDTLESMRKKKVDEEEKRRRKDKKRHRDRHEYNGDEKSYKKSKKRRHDDDDEHGSSKRRKHKKEKKSSSSRSKKKRRREVESEEEEEIQDQPLIIDLQSTLKELRQCSPTKELEMQAAVVESVANESDSSEDGEVETDRGAKKKSKKEDREYSEGEWSSDSDESNSEETSE